MLLADNSVMAVPRMPRAPFALGMNAQRNGRAVAREHGIEVTALFQPLIARLPQLEQTELSG
jgi:hypothetical protein